ncbi:MAG: ATP-binding cassette domain-containing protein [Rikenellaceae bacterium]
MLKIDIKQPLYTVRGRSLLEVKAEICDGEILCLQGASGIGKTTLLRIISGLIKPHRGVVEFNGDVWCDTDRGIYKAASRRKTGLMFQDFALFPNMTVMEQVLYAQPSRDESRVMDLLDCFGISALKGRHPHQLSGGQKQRVALARAIASEPTMLLLDEPFSALDWDLKGSLRDSIREAHKMLGSITIMVCHDPSDIEAMATSVLNFGFKSSDDSVVSTHMKGCGRGGIFGRLRRDRCQTVITCRMQSRVEGGVLQPCPI